MGLPPGRNIDRCSSIITCRQCLYSDIKLDRVSGEYIQTSDVGEQIRFGSPMLMMNYFRNPLILVQPLRCLMRYWSASYSDQDLKDMLIADEATGSSFKHMEPGTLWKFISQRQDSLVLPMRLLCPII